MPNDKKPPFIVGDSQTTAHIKRVVFKDSLTTAHLKPIVTPPPAPPLVTKKPK